MRRIIAIVMLIFVVAIMFGCSGGGGGIVVPPAANTITKNIGPNGGSITSTDTNLTVQVPAGALSTDTSISVTTSGDDYGQLGSVYHVGANGSDDAEFSVPVTLTFQYDPSKLRPDQSEGDLLIGTLGVFDEFEPLTDYSVDTANHVITATTSHFSPVLTLPTGVAGNAPKLSFPLEYTSSTVGINTAFDQNMVLVNKTEL